MGQFRKHYKWKLHFMINHSNEELSHSNDHLDEANSNECLYKCGQCILRFKSVALLTKHIKKAHPIIGTKSNSTNFIHETEYAMFKCELCDKNFKHSKNVIEKHVSTVHYISMKGYEDIVTKIRERKYSGIYSGYFDCIICGQTSRNRIQHLNKQHRIT